MKALLLDDNLMSATRVERGLLAANWSVVTARRAPDDGEFELVIFNLGSRSLDGLGQIETWRARFADAKIWAFCGHREVELWRAAKAAGVDKIVTNEVAMSEIGREVETM